MAAPSRCTRPRSRKAPATAPGDRYYIDLGVSKYRKPAYRLSYPHKDVQDLGAVLDAMKGKAFKNVHVARFVDERATVANLVAAKKLLANARVDDTVVLFVADHGIHADDAAAAVRQL